MLTRISYGKSNTTRRDNIMRVRVYDKDTDSYFVSEVYAIISNIEYREHYLVVQEIDNNRYFGLYNKGGSINLISIDKSPEPWVEKKEEELSYFTNILKPKEKYEGFYKYSGYALILEKKECLLQLIRGDKVPYEKIMGDKETSSKLDGWNYVECDEDIEILMKAILGFHDSMLESLNYISGSKALDSGLLHVFNDVRQVSMIFYNDWGENIEVVFEGILTLHLKPNTEDCDSIIFSASILLKDKTIFFYDDDVDEALEDYDGTWINALGMRWRFV